MLIVIYYNNDHKGNGNTFIQFLFVKYACMILKVWDLAGGV